MKALLCFPLFILLFSCQNSKENKALPAESPMGKVDAVLNKDSTIQTSEYSEAQNPEQVKALIDSTSLIMTEAICGTSYYCAAPGADGEEISEEEIEEMEANAEAEGTTCYFSLQVNQADTVLLDHLEFGGFKYSLRNETGKPIAIAKEDKIKITIKDRDVDTFEISNRELSLQLPEDPFAQRKSYDYELYEERKIRLFFQVDGENRMGIYSLKYWAG